MQVKKEQILIYDCTNKLLTGNYNITIGDYYFNPNLTEQSSFKEGDHFVIFLTH